MGGCRATLLQCRVDDAALDAVAIHNHTGDSRSDRIALTSRNGAFEFHHLTGHYLFVARDNHVTRTVCLVFNELCPPRLDVKSEDCERSLRVIFRELCARFVTRFID